MPMFDFECEDCHCRFEELVFEGDAFPPCPDCGGTNTKRLVSMPSPLKTGAFPFKVGPVWQPYVDKVRKAEAGLLPNKCGSGGCSACPHAVAPTTPKAEGK